jgi:hypothetical protein
MSPYINISCGPILPNSLSLIEVEILSQKKKNTKNPQVVCPEFKPQYCPPPHKKKKIKE